jgi:hypothetical protein
VAVIQAINDRVLGRNTWPPPGQRDVWDAIDLWSAFRRNDAVRLKQEASIPWQRRYLVSPVPRMISKAKANLLFGEPMEVRAASEGDQENIERIARENGLAGGHSPEAHRAAMIASSEREVWGRIVVDPTLADVPIIEWASRRHVIPHFSGRFVTGATFVKEWAEGSRRIYRLLEHYEPGVVRSELYLGTPQTLGNQLALDQFGPTEGVPDAVATGFDRPLCAFVPNALDADPSAGYGDYQGLEERFLAINEAATVGQENLRLAGKKRALVDAKYTRGGRLVPGDDVFIRADDEGVAGEGGKPLQMIDYGFEAAELKTYLDHLIDTTLTFGGAAPQLVGRSVDGGAISGTALKLKMIHSLMEASGTGGHFDHGHQRLLRMAAVIDSRRTTEGGFGRRWQTPDEDPTIARGDGLPRDDMEAAQWLVLVSGAEAISLAEKVRWLHPDWSEDQVDEEVQAIESSAPEPPAGGGPGGGLPAPAPGDVTPPGLPSPGTTQPPAPAPAA